jgi:hypothetical protein
MAKGADVTNCDTVICLKLSLLVMVLSFSLHSLELLAGNLLAKYSVNSIHFLPHKS